MKRQNNIAYNKAYIAGLNAEQATSLHSLNMIKTGLSRLLKGYTLPLSHIEKLIASAGNLERFHAPKEKPMFTRTHSEGWAASACSKNGDAWEQWIQTVSIQRSQVQIHPNEIEVIEEQTIMVGSDRHRMHIEWGTGRKEGYIHSSTSRYMSPEDFLETTAAPPNCLMALPAGCMAMYGFTLQTGRTLDTVDDSFDWFDSDGTRKWYKFLIYELGGTTYVCAVRKDWLYDALSGFDTHSTTICEPLDEPDDEIDDKPTDELYILHGSIRIDGMYAGKRRTAVLSTADILDDQIETLMDVVK